jgi:hypothetical protein
MAEGCRCARGAVLCRLFRRVGVPTLLKPLLQSLHWDWLRPLLLCVLPVTAIGEPWIAAGDPWLKADIQRLADAGVITSPISSWPLSAGDIAQDINAFQEMAGLNATTLRAFSRLRRIVREETRTGEFRGLASVSLGQKPDQIRGFQNLPRGELEATVAGDWTGDRFALRVQAGFVDEDGDSQDFRLDGSYATMALGNWMIGAAAVDRWWGPGWDGSLILSNNARPIPALILERNFSTAFANKWLSWMGPWSTSVIWGQLESDRPVPNARFFGWRANFRPLKSLEIGLLRTAQWCGAGRACDADAFLKVLTGSSNLDQGVAVDVANQLAGFDARWLSPLGSLPYAVYGQFIGEDEAGGFPSQYMGQFGLEFWGTSEYFSADWHAYLEYSDTSCRFSQSTPSFNCAYNNVFYADGYRFRGRPIGHSTDNDARTATIGLLARHDNLGRIRVSLKFSKLNRGGVPDPSNSLTSTPKDMLDVSLSHARSTDFGLLEFGIGARRLEDRLNGSDDSDSRGFIKLTQEF